MSKQKATATPPEDPYPSAEVMVGLKLLLGERMAKDKRVRAAWPLVLRAGGNSDFAVVADFALENDLIAPLEGTAGNRTDMKAARVGLWVNPVDGSEMVWIPPGPFRVGSNRESAECKGFSLARHPVTNALFARFVEETGYAPPADHPEPELFLPHWTRGAVLEEREEHPVVFVSLIDAMHYCRWAGLSLPTEWLWEKAARGPEGRTFPWGEQRYELGKGKLANVRAKDTCPVGRFPRTRTAYGCEDMIGNISEWCLMTPEGEYGRLPPAWPEIPPGPYAAVRGSAFLRTDQALMVASHRRRLSITRRNRWVGFRPACLIPYRPVL